MNPQKPRSLIQHTVPLCILVSRLYLPYRWVGLHWRLGGMALLRNHKCVAVQPETPCTISTQLVDLVVIRTFAFSVASWFTSATRSVS